MRYVPHPMRKPSQVLKPAKAVPVVTTEERLQAMVEWFLSTTQGREFAWHLIDEVCQLNGQTFAGEETHATAFHAGRRQVGIELMQLLQRFDPAGYRGMLTEAFARAAARNPVKRLRPPEP